MKLLRRLFGQGSNSEGVQAIPRDLISPANTPEPESPGTPTFESLTAQLKRDRSYRDRAEVARKLGCLEDLRSIAPLIELLKETAFDTRYAAARALVNLGEPALQHLLDAVNDHAISAYHAAFALGEMRDRRATPILVSLLQEGDILDKSIAAEALAKVADPGAIQPLLEALRLEPRSARKAITEALTALHWEPGTDEQRALVLVGQDRFQDAAALGPDAAPPLLAALRFAIAEKNWDPCEGPAKALCGLMGDSLREIEKELSCDNYNTRWAALNRILATVEGAVIVVSNSQDAIEAAVGKAIDITKRDFWSGLAWEVDPRKAHPCDFRTVQPGTYVLAKIEEGWIYIAQGSLRYKIDLGDVRTYWPRL